MKQSQWIASCVIGLGLMGPASTGARAGIVNLGTANAFNVFTLGDDTQQNTSAEGRVAVGGNASFGSGYTVATNRSGSTTDNLVVGGNYSNNYNSINGNVVVGGSASINGPTINGKLSVGQSLTLSGYGTVNGNVLYGTTYNNPNTTIKGTVAKGSSTLSVSFSDEKAYLTKLSNALASAAANGSANFSGNSANNQSGGFTLNGTSTGANLFHIKGSDLALCYGITLTAPAGSTVVIDVDGSADQMSNFGFTYNGIDKQHVLFNFSKASTLTLSGIGIQGSVLAPNAVVSFGNGSIDGTMVAGSLSGGGAAHDLAFLGDLSPIVGANFGVTPVSVPEPSAMALTSVGIGLVGLASGRRKAKA